MEKVTKITLQSSFFVKIKDQNNLRGHRPQAENGPNQELKLVAIAGSITIGFYWNDSLGHAADYRVCKHNATTN